MYTYAWMYVCMYNVYTVYVYMYIYTYLYVCVNLPPL